MAISVEGNDIVTARLEYLNGSDIAYNVLHYRIVNLTDDTSHLPPAIAIPWSALAPAAAQAVFEYFDGPWATIASQDVVMTGCTVQDVYPAPRSRPFTFLPEANVQGLRVSEALPLQDSLTILKKSEYGMRWGIGRVFVVGLAENSQAGGNISIAARSDLVSYALFFADNIAVDAGDYSFQLQPVLFADVKDPETGEPTGAVRTTAITRTAIESWTLKTQRRRRPGKGI